jgi:hypothetical protein
MSKLAHSDDLSMLLIEASTRGIKVKTNNVFPPIPLRQFDWSAVDDATYDGEGCAIGYGSTEAEAVSDLLEQMEG